MTQAPEYRLVPVEPVFPMDKAGQEALFDYLPRNTIERNEEIAIAVFRAMIAAAPLPAAPAADRAVSELPPLPPHPFGPHKSLAMEAYAIAYAKSAVAADRALARSTDAPSEPLKNLQTWLTCKLIGNAATPQPETIKAWITALVPLTGDEVPSFAQPDNSRCKFASGGARCVSPCGDPVCLATPPAATTSTETPVSTPGASGEEEAVTDRVTVRSDAVDWLKKYYPALCEKSGLCERVGGRLYTRTFLAASQAPAVPATQVRHTPEEWGPSTARRLTCSCGDPDPAHMDKGRTPTAGNTEDARGMGATFTLDEDELRQLLMWHVGRHAHWLGRADNLKELQTGAEHEQETRDEADRHHARAEALRAALTQAASTGGAAS